MGGLRIFLKDISKNELYLLDKYPIHGLVLSISQRNTEEIRSIVEQLPFYITIIGQLPFLPKYMLEEIIYFCKLDSIIITDPNNLEHLSCPQIVYSGDEKWNSLMNEKSTVKTKTLPFNELLEEDEGLIGLVLTTEELLNNWSELVSLWGET